MLTLCFSFEPLFATSARKEGRARISEPALCGLEACDVRGLQALGALGDLEFDRLALV